MKRLLTLFAALLFSAPLLADAHGLVGESIVYHDGEVELHGYLAYDPSLAGERPAVLVVHEWWGHNEHAREQARRLARLGYTALAVDMFGDGRQADHPNEAGAFAGQVRRNRDLMMSRFNAALDWLHARDDIDAARIAAIGYCFGGSVVLEMARAGAELLGVASFHGALATDHPAQAGTTTARVLVLHGAEDPLVPQEQVLAFIDEMEGAGIDYRLIAYPGATHSFTNPAADQLAERFDMPVGYHAEADAASWEELERFLEALFQ